MGDGIMALVWRAAFPRRSRGARLLRGAANAGVGATLCGPECGGPKVCRFQIRVGLNSGEVVVGSIATT